MVICPTEESEFVSLFQTIRNGSLVLPGSHRVVHRVGSAVSLRSAVPGKNLDCGGTVAVEGFPVYSPVSLAIADMVWVDHHFLTCERLIQLCKAVSLYNLATVLEIVDVVIPESAGMPFIA